VRAANDSDRPARAAVPVPDRPPYTAHVGNLSFEATESEISNFFASCDVTNVRLVRDREQDRPKGFGYVEFGTKDGLLGALELNGSQLAGRPVRINVADPRECSPVRYGTFVAR
jgi:translation initiation factor 4B